MQPLLEELGINCATTHLYAGERPMLTDGDDALIVLGGPMSVADIDSVPWLSAEKSLVADVLNTGFPVLGICLGAQMMAEALGGTVAPMGYREIGWHQVRTNPAIKQTWLGKVLESEFTALHWHGERFELPPGVIPLGASAACDTQGFLAKPQQLGLQFHLEFNQSSVHRLVRNCADELDGGCWVQCAEEMLANEDAFSSCQRRMRHLMEGWVDAFN